MKNLYKSTSKEVKTNKCRELYFKKSTRSLKHFVVFTCLWTIIISKKCSQTLSRLIGSEKKIALLYVLGSNEIGKENLI